MEIYRFEGGRELVKSGETRWPRRGEYYIAGSGNIAREGYSGWTAKDAREILIPKEQKVCEVQDEYQIPVLVKARMADKGYRPEIRDLAGKIILCREASGLLYSREGGQQGGEEGWNRGQVIAWPTPAHVEAERANLSPKPNILPAPVRAALDAADLGCRKEGIEKLVEAMYAHPPKVSP
jgi:hypothetical protein